MEKSIITWWSAGGGEGKTTLAVSQAYQVAKTTGKKVALLDFKEVNPGVFWKTNVPFVDVMPIYNAIEKGELNENLLNKYMAEYKSCRNLKIFTGIDLNNFEFFTEKHFTTIIDSLKTYPYIIIDTNGGIFFAGTFVALKKATKINVVVEPTYQSLSDTTKMISFVEDKWGVSKDKFNIYGNKLSSLGLDRKAFEKVFVNYKIKGFFNYNDKIIERANLGMPIEEGCEELLSDFGINSSIKRTYLANIFYRWR